MRGSEGKCRERRSQQKNKNVGGGTDGRKEAARLARFFFVLSCSGIAVRPIGQARQYYVI
jgi:hypothetical protein